MVMSASRTQQGLSLVELMVAMMLGLLITAAVIQLFLTNRQTFNLQQGIASVQEQGRFAVDFLSKEIMGAGYGSVPAPIKVSTIPGEKASRDGARYDSLYMLMDNNADYFDQAPNKPKGPRDCSGGALNRTSAGTINPAETFKRYYVNVEADGNGVLMCEDSDGSNVVLLDNVEVFQVLYGVASRDANATRYRYVSATDLDPGDDVVSVRFAVLVSSDGVAVSERDQANAVEIFGTSYTDQVDFYDGKLRRLFVSSVALRNVAGG